MLFSCQNQVQQPRGIDLEKTGHLESARKNEELHRAPLGMGSCGCVVSGSHTLPFVVSSPVRNGTHILISHRQVMAVLTAAITLRVDQPANVAASEIHLKLE